MNIRIIDNNYYNTCYNCACTLSNHYMYIMDTDLKPSIIICANCLYELYLKAKDIFDQEPNNIDIRITDNNIYLEPYKMLIKQGMVVKAIFNLRKDYQDVFTLNRVKYIIYNLVIQMIDNNEIPAHIYVQRNITPQEWRRDCVELVHSYYNVKD